MQSRLLSKLSEASISNDSQEFFRLLREELQRPEDLVNESNINIYHELANSQLHEKYLLTFAENITQIILDRFTNEDLKSLITMQSKLDDNYSPLHFAILRGKNVKIKQALAKRFLEIGASPTTESAKGRNSLHMCAESGLIGMFLFINMHYHLDVNAEDNQGMTPLHLAISERREDMAMVIISLITDGIDLEKEAKKSVLELAVDIGSYRLTRQILLNQKPLQSKKKAVGKIKKKCDDKDIKKLLKKSTLGKKSYSKFVITMIVLIMKDIEMWYWLGVNLFFIENFIDFCEICGQLMMIIVVLGLMIWVNIKNPGYETQANGVGLIELYSKYIPEYVCPYCIVKKHKGTKHCFVCKKCIRHYDHHCIWLNSCIGKTNHKVFIVFLVSLILSNIFSLYFVVYDIYSIYINNIIRAFDNPGLSQIYYYLLIISLILNSIILFFITPIIIKQIKLFKKNIRQRSKLPSLKKMNYSKNFLACENESTSDTASMLIKDVTDSNSESASSTVSLLSQFFTK